MVNRDAGDSLRSPLSALVHLIDIFIPIYMYRRGDKPLASFVAGVGKANLTLLYIYIGI